MSRRLGAGRRRELVAGLLALVVLGLGWRTSTHLSPGRVQTSISWYDGTLDTHYVPGTVDLVVRHGAEEPVRVLLVPAGVLLLWSALGARPARWARPAAASALLVAAALALAEAGVAPTAAVLVAAALAASRAWPALGGRLRRAVGVVLGAGPGERGSPSGSTPPASPG